MTRSPTTFRGETFVAAGREESAVRRAARLALSGQCTAPNEGDLALHRQRLDDIGAELNLLFAYRLEAEDCFAKLSETVEPVLVLGKSTGLALTVEIEPQTGFFVLCEESGQMPCVLVTASAERLVDQIVSIASSAHRCLAPRTVDGAIDVLVGQSIDEVERRLVLRTMRYFRGNSAQAAFALGVSESDLMVLVRRFLADRRANASGPAEGSSEGCQ